MRVELFDDAKLDLAATKQLPGVSGYVKQGQQHQFIVGPGKAAQVVDAMRAQMSGADAALDNVERNKAQGESQIQSPNE